MTAKSLITAEVLKELLHYEPLTGVFTWHEFNYGRLRKRGLAAGCIDKRRGVVVIRVNKELHSAHRLAWLYVHGEWPTHEIDHIDGDPSNNRLSNLREATSNLNKENKRRAQSNNRLGVIGVSMSRGRYLAQISTYGSRLFIGRYDTLEEASAAYLKVKRRLHEGCTI